MTTLLTLSLGSFILAGAHIAHEGNSWWVLSWVVVACFCAMLDNILRGRK